MIRCHVRDFPDMAGIWIMQKLNADASAGEKLLRLFQKLMLDGRRHFQSDLAEYLGCSPQSVMRLIAEIECVVGDCLVTGLEKHRRWYQIRSISRNRLGLDFEELRYLSICRDLAEPYLSKNVKERVDQSIFNFSMLMADEEYAEREKVQNKQVGHCFKGWIDYTPYFDFLEKLVEAREKNVVCLVKYKALASDRFREHRFALSRIVSMNNALYALGAGVTDDFTEIRHPTNLAVHRIKDVILTDKPVRFKIPEGDLSMFGLPWHEPRQFRIRFNAGKAAQYVRERVWSDKQKFSKQEDGSLVLDMMSRSEPEVMAWVRSFGDEAEILEYMEDVKHE